MKLILETDDIKDLIKKKFPNLKNITGLKDDLEVSVEIDNYTPPPPDPTIVRTDDGSIDAEKSGLVAKSRPVTKPGQAMGTQRGRLPVF